MDQSAVTSPSKIGVAENNHQIMQRTPKHGDKRPRFAIRLCYPHQRRGG